MGTNGGEGGRVTISKKATGKKPDVTNYILLSFLFAAGDA